MTYLVFMPAEGSTVRSRGAFDQANDAQITNARNRLSAAFQHLIPTGDLGETRVAIWKHYPEPGPWDLGPLIEGPVHLDYGSRIHIAPTANIDKHCTIVYTPMADVRIGERVRILPGVTIISADCSGVDKNGKSLTTGRDVTIGDWSWIGFDVVIMRVPILSMFTRS
ncbi:hypothetical protein CDV36_012011 [Fusarium kuroshium]|uniref:Mannose-1-phosphate guanylyltransferase n=1 Tax=Fusarium kuroshium TaxID=2010991 RepID=A0A3M2RSR2_9HYPO|nr:hypothetical protein CDV36_012011 [Fusarium kuroshium]